MQSASTDEDSPADELDKLSVKIEFLDQDTRLEDIGGLEAVKERLRKVALAFTHQDDRRKGNPVRPQGVLLYGEPGTGKKILVEALANEIGAALWPIQSSDIYQGPNASPEANMNAIFNGAKQLHERTVLLFHDFEALFSNNPEAANETNYALADLFKQQVEALLQANPNILVAVTTNQPGNIDSSLIDPDRFPVAIHIPMPDEAARAQIFTNLIARSMAHSTPFGNDLSVDELAYETDGMSGADINNVLKQAFTRAQHGSEPGTETPISQDDIIAAIQTFKTT
jgi:SpoVK/Ycf46/Vps4 family AAA+-type ATPase